jgi:hypothetical protein
VRPSRSQFVKDLQQKCPHSGQFSCQSAHRIVLPSQVTLKLFGCRVGEHRATGSGTRANRKTRSAVFSYPFNSRIPSTRVLSTALNLATPCLPELERSTRRSASSPVRASVPTPIAANVNRGKNPWLLQGRCQLELHPR